MADPYRAVLTEDQRADLRGLVGSGTWSALVGITALIPRPRR